MSSGTDALLAALLALGIGAGDEVIVPDITFISSATSVLHAGAEPVFADVERATVNLDAESVEQAVTPRTKAIMAVHYAGQACSMEPLLAVARHHRLAVIEDAAEAHGATYRGQSVGTFGAAAMFSFTPTKNITTGEGGLVTTDDDALAERLRLLRNHGSRVTYHHELVGYNYRMTEMQAAMGVEQLKKLPRILERKRQLARLLTELLAPVPGVETPTEAPDRSHTYQMYTIQVDARRAGRTRDQLAEHLAARGVQTRVCFPPLHRQPIFQGRGLATPLPVSEALGAEILSLPIHSKLTDEKIRYVAGNIAAAIRGGAA
jgi:perosamine synthetase